MSYELIAQRWTDKQYLRARSGRFFRRWLDELDEHPHLTQREIEMGRTSGRIDRDIVEALDALEQRIEALETSLGRET